MRDFIIGRATPIITWANPADIFYGTALSATQLNASASVPGSFVYTPAAGTVLNAGAGQTLHVDFTPTDTATYTTASANVTINVLSSNQTISFAALPNKTYGDADFTVSATASSGLLVSFTSSGNCTVTGNTVHLTGAGSCTITAHQAGNSNYNPAPDVARTFTIAPAAPSGPTCNGQAATIYVNAQGRIVGGADNGKVYRGELKGTNGADVIVGTNAKDEIEGKGGNDVICGGNGNDELEGGSGNDKLFGEAGKDELKGDDGNDTLTGGTEADKFNGGSGKDTATDYNRSQGDSKSSVETF